MWLAWRCSAYGLDGTGRHRWSVWLNWMQRHESYEYPVLGITGGARRLPLDLASRWLLHERTLRMHLPWRSSRLWSPYRQCVLAFIFGPATNQRPCTLWVLSHSWAWPASSSVHEPFATGIPTRRPYLSFTLNWEALAGRASESHAPLGSIPPVASNVLGIIVYFGLYIHNGGHASLPSGTYPHAGCCWRIRQAHWTVSRIQAMCGLHRGLVRCGSRVDVTDVGVTVKLGQ